MMSILIDCAAAVSVREQWSQMQTGVVITKWWVLNDVLQSWRRSRQVAVLYIQVYNLP